MKENGRVIFNNQFLLSDKFRNKEEITSYSDSMKGLWYNTILSEAYFSADNIKYIQDKIRYNVFNKTDKVIDQQSIDTLKNIMRSIFLKFSKNRKENIKQQITDLDNIVINYCVTEIIGSLESYLIYMKDISNIPTPIGLPNNTGVKGERPLELKRFY